jgi:hypothetical protein
MEDKIVGPVDHLFRLGVDVMYHEAMYLDVQHILKTYGSAGQIFSPSTSFYVSVALEIHVEFTCSSESHSPGGWLRP